MKSWYSHFIGTGVFCVVAVALGYYVGGLPAVATVLFLSVLETSLSFDNAVVNAGILANWDEKWRRRFLTWGIFIAVFGMRLVFPVAIVAIAAGIGPFQAIDLAINDGDEYSRVLGAAHHQIAAFGGAFLMMVFLRFFVARHKTEHWLEVLERPLSRLGKLESIEAALSLMVVMAASWIIADPVRQGEFVVAGVWGVVVFIIVKGLAALLGGDDETAHTHVVKQGVAGFLYLEVLDASFSFDGVVGAFALTHDLIVIALGLGVGAMFVRSFTLLLVERGTLETYRYLEHGAFWAVGALAAIMLGGVEFHIPEAITGLLGAALIVWALGSSVRANRRTVS
ncbi:MAG: DUF475 domain-containing protein [Gammaproteobacteria bacterium]|nr:DUF475 domain-containing protein [Gammaproteobacteria bacterium]MBU1415619.1 DUF475 domain-containing protein [Gammaproteobacteria bacterium]